MERAATVIQTTARPASAPAATPQEVATMLRRRVHDGTYSAGQKLIEMDLADEFGVGRGRLREAFRLLVGEGYLVSIANRGVFVRRYSKRELLDMGRAREALEGLMARLAAEKPLDTEARAALEAVQDRLDAAEAALDLERYHRENIAYHRLIENLAGNAHVGELVSRVRIPLIGLRLPQSVNEDSLVRSNRGHRFITFSILANAPDAAEAAMRSHVAMGNEHIASLPDEVFR